MMASNKSYDRVRMNQFSRKHVFGQKKKGRGQQLRDACANRKFLAAKRMDMAEMQPCIAIAVSDTADAGYSSQGWG